MDFSIEKCKIKEIIDNQKALQTYVEIDKDISVDALVDKYNTAIFCECGEAIMETNFKWWKYKEVNIESLKEELADIFIFALDFALILGQEEDVNSLVGGNWKRVQPNNETDFRVMITRLKTIGSPKYANTFGEKFGMFVMRAIIDIIVLYGYRDFLNVVTNKQLKNIDRQENGYNRKAI